MICKNCIGESVLVGGRYVSEVELCAVHVLTDSLAEALRDFSVGFNCAELKAYDTAKERHE